MRERPASAPSALVAIEFEPNTDWGRFQEYADRHRIQSKMYAPRGGVCATVIAEASIGVTSTIIAATIAAMLTFIDMDILHIESTWVTVLIRYELFSRGVLLI